MTRSTRRVRRGLALLGLIAVFGGAQNEAQARQSKADPVAWMLFVDDLHLHFPNTGRLRNLLRTILSDLPKEGDLIAIRTAGPSAVLTDFGSGNSLVPQLRNLTGNGLRPTDIIVAPSDREVRYRAQLSLSVATSATALLGQVHFVRRALIYISEGHPFDVSALPEGRALAQTAMANGVRVFVIDGRILNEGIGPTVADPKWNEYLTTARTSLRVIAEQSGGFAVFDRDEIPVALERIGNVMR